MVPLLFPMLGIYDINPILFGVVVVLFVELAQFTHPMGMDLFIIPSVCTGTLGDVIKGSILFCLLIVFMAFLLVAFPGIAVWLHETMARG